MATSGAANGMNKYESWTSGDLVWQAFWACKQHGALPINCTQSVKLVPRNLIYPDYYASAYPASPSSL